MYHHVRRVAGDAGVLLSSLVGSMPGKDASEPALLPFLLFLKGPSHQFKVAWKLYGAIGIVWDMSCWT